MGEPIPHLQTEKNFRPGTRPGRKWIAFDLPPAGGKLCEALLKSCPARACLPQGRAGDRIYIIPKPVKKLEKLFIAPKVRQVLYGTSQRVFTRCACAQRTGFLIKIFNQESVSELHGESVDEEFHPVPAHGGEGPHLAQGRAYAENSFF